MLMFASAAALLLAQASSAQPWKLDRVEDPISAQVTQQLSLPGDTGSIVLVCTPGSKKVRFIVASDEFVGSSRVKDVRWRFTPGIAGESYWRYGNDHAAEPFKNGDLQTMLENVANAKAVVFELKRYDYTKVYVKVDLSGAGRGLAAWYSACGIATVAGLKTDA